jgi:hypothetical protein
MDQIAKLSSLCILRNGVDKYGKVALMGRAILALVAEAHRLCQHALLRTVILIPGGLGVDPSKSVPVRALFAQRETHIRKLRKDRGMDRFDDARTVKHLWRHFSPPMSGSMECERQRTDSGRGDCPAHEADVAIQSP